MGRKIKNVVLTFDSIPELMKAKEEYDYIGREVDVFPAEKKLVVLALPRKYKKKSIREAKLARRREDHEYDYDKLDKKYNNR